MSEIESAPAETQSTADLRASVLAELEAPEAEEAPADEATTEEAEPTPDTETASDEQPEAELEVEPEAADPEPATDDPDAKTQKALDRIQAEEKQSRTRIESERAEVAAIKAEWVEKISASEARETEFKAAQSRAKRDPAALLKLLGVTDKVDLMNAARQLHSIAVADSPDATPQQREQADRSLRERDTEDRISRMEAENKALREEMATSEQNKVNEQNVRNYTTQVLESVAAETLVGSLAATSPALAHSRIAEYADELWQKTGEVPDASDVIKLFEEAERKSLSDRGLDPDLILQGMKRTKTKTPTAGENRSASIGTNNGTTTKPVAQFESREDLLADVLRDIET